MKILENMDLCYGCAACANICPKGAISMTPAEDGFLYPKVSDALCVNCNACRTVCPQLNAEYDNSRSPAVYAVMADNETRALSASGGMFSLLAEYAFERDGYVCGAAFEEDFRHVKHIMIKEREELDKLRRSKYVQSENGTIHRQVKEKLDAGEFVLFTGTPCQCAAVKAYLRKPYENLLLVDLICHGTPSPMAWNRFLNEVGPGQAVRDVNFRYKGVIGWSATTHVEFENGTEYTKLFKECAFEQASSKNLISRKSCSSCQFARTPRQGDITIGDFWGIHLIQKGLDDRKGTSAVLLNTPKGKRVFAEIKEKGIFRKAVAVPFKKAFANNNSNIHRFPAAHPGRQRFFDALAEGKKFSDALAASVNEKYDIMLFSIWYAANYGSMMTNFALYQMLKDMGYNCVFADIPDHLWPTSAPHREHQFVTRRFGYKHFKITGRYKNRVDLKKVNNLADTFIVGSDQIWNYSLCKTADTYFYLDFVDDDKKKIAYGTSFGHKKFSGDEAARRRAGFYLNRFDAVSVREDYAVDLCRDKFGVDAVQVLDPVFMCDKKHYLHCIEESRVRKDPPKKKYVLAYVLDPTEEKQVLLEECARRMDADLLVIPNASVKAEMRKAWRLPLLEGIDMEDWLYYFQNAEMVITDSFHGTCFSLIFEKPFIAIGNKRRGLERFHSLLGNVGLMDRLVFTPKEALSRDDLFTSGIDYQRVNQALDALRAESMMWLKNALETDRKAPVYSAYDLLDRRIDSLAGKTEKMATEMDSIQRNSSAKKAEEQMLINSEEAEHVRQLEERLAELTARYEEQEQRFLQMQQEMNDYIARWENSVFGRLTKVVHTAGRRENGADKT